MYLWNDSNFGWGTAINFQADVMNAVNNGLQVVAFDRSANRFSDAPLPSLAQGNFAPSRDVEFTTDGLNAFGNGFGGAVTQTSLDGFADTIHGWTHTNLLPPGATSLAHVAGNTNQVVGFNYTFGAGQVSYFSMPVSAASTFRNPNWETFAINTLSGVARLFRLRHID